jgi:hypothetical protein
MADARAATRFKGCTPKLRTGAARVTGAARTADAESVDPTHRESYRIGSCRLHERNKFVIHVARKVAA